MQNFRPTRRDLAPHAGVMIARTGENKGEVAGFAERIRAEKEAAAGRRVRAVTQDVFSQVKLLPQFVRAARDDGQAELPRRVHGVSLPPGAGDLRHCRRAALRDELPQRRGLRQQPLRVVGFDRKQGVFVRRDIAQRGGRRMFDAF